MINDLIKLATHLDNKGLHKEANYVDAIIRKMSEDYSNGGWSTAPTMLQRLEQGGKTQPPEVAKKPCSHYRQQIGAKVLSHSAPQRQAVEKIQDLVKVQPDKCYGRSTKEKVVQYAKSKNISITGLENGDDPNALLRKLLVGGL